MQQETDETVPASATAEGSGVAVSRLVRLVFVSCISAGSLADSLQGVEVSANHVSRVSSGTTNILNSKGAESLGRRGELIPGEIFLHFSQQPVEPTYLGSVGSPHVIGLPVVGSLDVGTPLMDESHEIPLPISAGSARSEDVRNQPSYRGDGDGCGNSYNQALTHAMWYMVFSFFLGAALTWVVAGVYHYFWMRRSENFSAEQWNS